MGSVGRQWAQASWPSTWEDRVAGWRMGASYRMDWPRKVFYSLNQTSGTLVTERQTLTQPALIGPDRSGRLLAFSAQAVNAAAQAWEFFQAGWMYCPAWHVAWLNGVGEGRQRGFASGRGLAGLDLIEVGTGDLVFCPEVLGPLGHIAAEGAGPRLAFPRFTVSPNLSLRVDQSGLYVRGAALADGWWRHGSIEPISSEGGWLFIPLGLSEEEVVVE